MYANEPYELFRGKKAEVCASAAQACLSVIEKAVAENGQALIAVSGGRGTVSLLLQLEQLDRMPWQDVHIFWSDEKWIPLEHPDSNFYRVWGDMLAPMVQRGVLHQDQVHPFRYSSDLPDGGVGLYQSEFRRVSSQSGDRFDLVVVDVGDDGHCAGLYPYHSAVSDERYGFIEVHNAPQMPSERMTISRPLLAASRAAVVLFFGEHVHGAFARFSDTEVSEEGCPAKIALHAGQTIAVSEH